MEMSKYKKMSGFFSFAFPESKFKKDKKDEKKPDVIKKIPPEWMDKMRAIRSAYDYDLTKK
jgi:hypothetical protein